jgi:hypothetical protein
MDDSLDDEIERRMRELEELGADELEKMQRGKCKGDIPQYA